jgi:hypothetical protein
MFVTHRAVSPGAFVKIKQCSFRSRVLGCIKVDFIDHLLAEAHFGIYKMT